VPEVGPQVAVRGASQREHRLPGEQRELDLGAVDPKRGDRIGAVVAPRVRAGRGGGHDSHEPQARASAQVARYSPPTPDPELRRSPAKIRAKNRTGRPTRPNSGGARRGCRTPSM